MITLILLYSHGNEMISLCSDCKRKLSENMNLCSILLLAQLICLRFNTSTVLFLKKKKKPPVAERCTSSAQLYTNEMNNGKKKTTKQNRVKQTKDNQAAIYY